MTFSTARFKYLDNVIYKSLQQHVMGLKMKPVKNIVINGALGNLYDVEETLELSLHREANKQRRGNHSIRNRAVGELQHYLLKRIKNDK